MKKTYSLLALLLFSLPGFAENMHFSLVYTAGPQFEVSGHGRKGNLYISGKKNATVRISKLGITRLTATTTHNFSSGLIDIFDDKGEGCTISYTNNRASHCDSPLKIIFTTLHHRCHVQGNFIQIG